MPASRQAPAGSQLLVLTNANFIDGVSEHPIRQATVIVRDGKIVSVAATYPNILVEETNATPISVVVNSTADLNR